MTQGGDAACVTVCQGHGASRPPSDTGGCDSVSRRPRVRTRRLDAQPPGRDGWAPLESFTPTSLAPMAPSTAHPVARLLLPLLGLVTPLAVACVPLDTSWTPPVAEDVSPDAEVVAADVPEPVDLDRRAGEPCEADEACGGGLLCLRGSCLLDCPAGLWGAECAESCPTGWPGGPVCSGRGSCDEGLRGSGVCRCGFGFEGDACGGAAVTRFTVTLFFDETGAIPDQNALEVRFGGELGASPALSLGLIPAGLGPGASHVVDVETPWVGPLRSIEVRPVLVGGDTIYEWTSLSAVRVTSGPFVWSGQGARFQGAGAVLPLDVATAGTSSAD